MMDYHQGPMTEQGSPMRRLEEQRSRAVADASRLYEARHPEGPLLDVNVAFRRDEEPGAGFAEDLAAFVADNLPREDSIGLHAHFGSATELTQSALSVLIARLDVFTRNFWVSVDHGSFGWNHEEIQRQIDAKRRKATAYLERCDEAWLLLVAGAQVQLSGMVGRPTDVAQFSADPLSKVLLYDRFKRTVTELPLVPPSKGPR